MPLVDSGPTLATQAPPVELSGQVRELAAKLGVGWTGEGCPPPGVAPEAVRQPSPEERVETMSVSKDRVPLRRSGAPIFKRRGTDDHPRGRGRYAAHEGCCSPRGRGWSPQDSAVAMLDGDGEMPGLLSRFAGGGGDTALPPAPASLRSPPRRVFRKWERRRKCKRRKRCRAGSERRCACSPDGREAPWVSRSVHHRCVRPPGRVRLGHRRARSSRQCAAPCGELPRSCVAGAGWTEISSACRKGTVNVCRSLVGADEWSDDDRETRVSSVTPGPLATMAAAGRQSHRLGQAAPRPTSEAVERYPNPGRSLDEVNRHGNADDLLGAVDPAASKEKGKSKGKGNWSLGVRFQTMDYISSDQRPFLADHEDGATLRN